MSKIASAIDYPELQQPLNQFNGLRLNRTGAWHLVKSFNSLSDRPIKDRVLERTFEKFWSDLDNSYALLFPDSREKGQPRIPTVAHCSQADGRSSRPVHFAEA